MTADLATLTDLARNAVRDISLAVDVRLSSLGNARLQAPMWSCVPDALAGGDLVSFVWTQQIEDHVLVRRVRQSGADALNGVRYPRAWPAPLAAIDAFGKALSMTKVASEHAAPWARCEYLGAVSCEHDDEFVWNPFLWELCSGPEDAQLAFAWYDVQNGDELGIVVCGLQGHGPKPPVVDDEPSSNEAGSEECEIENTQEIEMWETINANLDKLEPLVDVDGMTRDE